ncbi:MAG: sigma-70 family RNA polymerase sigma factor [Planctomycetia bacterium]|nr:sigma-70 family RNA polymerase sigma factor [Planctomycetia bacterium]
MDVDKHRQFAERVVRTQQRVFRYLVSLVPNRADAEELFQQTCLTLWENWERYDPALDFLPWACGIAHNHVRNFHRKRQNTQVQLELDVVDMLAARSCELRRTDDDKLAALRQCLAQLNDPNRLLIEGYYGGKTVPEIAAQRSATPNAVYKLLHRIRETLHDCVSMRLARGIG